MNRDGTKPLILAPMAGVTDSPFRRLIKRYGCDVIFSEMLSAEALIRNNRRTFEMMDYHEDERPIVFQLVGGRIDAMAEAAEIAVSRGVQALDINMGCPVKKVTNAGGGSALLRDLPQAEELARAVVRAGQGALVSAKIRAGWDHRRIVAVELARRLEQAGVQAVTVHGRTREQFYSGKSDWSVVAAVKQAVSIPVIGNGDVTDGESASQLAAQTKCDGIMIGRAAVGNPWVFQLCKQVADGLAAPGPGISERMALFLEHMDLMSKQYPARAVLCRAKLHAPGYLRGIPSAAQARYDFCRLATIDAARAFIQHIGRQCA